MNKENKKYSIFQIPYYSFYSKELFRDIAQNRKGTLFGYLFLLMAVCWSFSIAKWNAQLNKFFNNELPPIIEQIPEARIVDGELSIKEDQPYFIYAPKTKKVLAIIDTFGTVESLEDNEAFLLLTKTKIYFKANKSKTEAYRLKELFKAVNSFTLDQTKINEWINILRRTVIPFFYVFLFLFSFLFRISQMLIYAAIGLLFRKWLKTEMSYAALIRLAVTAVSPVMIISTILGLANTRLPFAYLLYFLGAMGYLFFGIKAGSVKKEPEAGGVK